jgi:hypothetical protein
MGAASAAAAATSVLLAEGWAAGSAVTGVVTAGGVTMGGVTTVAVVPPVTPTEVEPREIGTVIGATIWVPERTPPAPLVEAAGAGADAGAGPVPTLPGPSTLAAESPIRPSEVAPRLTGTVIGATIWVPERMPSLPLMDAGAGAEVVPGVPAPLTLAAESPSRPSEVAPRLMGMLMGATTWVPDRSPSVPEVVSAALAATPPKPKGRLRKRCRAGTCGCCDASLEFS